MSGPRFTATYTGDHEVLDKGRWTATFEYLADAEAYVAWRNSPPTELKFKVGDWVRFHGGDEYTVQFGPAWFLVHGEGGGSKDHWHMEEDMELAPPEPPKPKWRVEDRWDSTVNARVWDIIAGDDDIGTLRDEHFARELCDQQNAKEQAQ